MTTQTLEQPPLNVRKPDPRPSSAPWAVRKWPTEATVFAWLLLAGGTLFRIRCYFHWTSFSLTELELVHNLLTRGFQKLLFEPLDFSQGAPAGFLILERLCVDVLGTGERILRLPSLLASLASLPLFFLLTRRVLTLRGAILAIALFAGLDPLIHYSAELAPYSIDVTVALAILLSAVVVVQRPDRERNLLVLFVVGAVGLFLSYPAAMVLGGSGAVALGAYLASGKRDGFIRSAAAPIVCAVVWIGLEWVNVHFFLHPLMYGPTHQELVRDWMQWGGYPPWQPNRAVHWVWAAFHDIFQNWETMYLGAPDLAMYAAILGLGGLLLGKRRKLGLLLLLPLVLALSAAFRRQYPLADHLALYMVPLLIILIAQGIDLIWGKEDLARSAAGGLAAVMLLSGALAQSGYEFRWPGGREETKEVYQWLQHNWRTGDLLVLSHVSQRSFDYYAPRTGLAGLEQLWPAPPGTPMDKADLLEASTQGAAEQPWFVRAFTPPAFQPSAVSGYVVLQPDYSSNPGQYLDNMDQICHPDPSWHWPPARRIWFVFARPEDQNPRVDQLCLAELDRIAQPGVRHLEDGAAVYFYEVQRP